MQNKNKTFAKCVCVTCNHSLNLGTADLQTGGQLNLLSVQAKLTPDFIVIPGQVASSQASCTKFGHAGATLKSSSGCFPTCGI